MRSYAVDVIANPRESAMIEGTGFRFHELLETIARQLFIFDVVRFVLVYIGLIFECKLTTGSSAVKVRSPLAGKLTIVGRTILGCPKSLEALLYDRRVLAMIIRVHLYV